MNPPKEFDIRYDPETGRWGAKITHWHPRAESTVSFDTFNNLLEFLMEFENPDVFSEELGKALLHTS